MKQAGRKHGRLSNGAKDPNSGVGLNWDAIREARAKRLEEEYERGIRNPDTVEHYELIRLSAEEQKLAQKKREEAASRKAFSSTPKSKGTGKGQKKGPRWDVDEGVRLYLEENMSPTEIAKALGLAYETVIKGLKYREVFDPNKHRKAQGAAIKGRREYARQKYCGVCGTDLDVPGNSRERFKKGPDGTVRKNGRECVPCLERRRKVYNEKYSWANDPRNPKNGGQGTHKKKEQGDV